MGKQKWLGPVLLIVLVISILCNRLWFKHNAQNNEGARIENGKRRGGEDVAADNERGGLNRNATSLIYSKHARCRMACRQISEGEVVQILKEGKINYQKSEMRGEPDPKYALEGRTRDGQQVRIIFANSARGIVVVTVIDLEQEWKCNCK